MSHKFKLVEHEVVAVKDTLEWARWFETAERHIANDNDTFPWGRVSTVFLGLEHNFGMGGPPIVFETMVFGGPFDGEQERYCTWDEAVAGHKTMLEKVTA